MAEFFARTPLSQSLSAYLVIHYMGDTTQADSVNCAAYGWPPLLAGYVVFVTATLVVSISILLLPKFAEFAVPYFGHPVIGLFYGGTLVWVAMKLVAPTSYSNTNFLLAVRNSLGIAVLFSVCVALVSWFGGNYNNPYLTVYAAQPLWTVGVPVAWYLALKHFAANGKCVG